MVAFKTETITVWIGQAVKEGSKAMAEQERRSLAYMIEVMIRAYCGGNGKEIQEAAGAVFRRFQGWRR